MKHSLKEQVKGSLVRPLGLRVATGLSPTFKLPLIESVSSVPSGLVSTFTRGSTGTYIDDDGLLQTATSGVIRFQNGRYLVELSATNSTLYSKALSSWIVSNCTITPDAIITPLGLASDKLSQISSITNNIYQIRTLSVSTSYCFSFLIKNIDAIRSRFSPYNLSASTQLGELLIGWTGSVPSTYSNTGFTSVSYTDMSDGWYLVVCCVTTAASGTSHSIRFYPEYSVTTGKSIYLTRIQMEAGVSPTSYIPTTSSVLARAADVLYYDVSSAITQGQGSLYCEFWDSNISGPIRMVLNISDGTNFNRLYVSIRDDGALSALGVTAGTDVISVAGGSITSTLNKVLLTYKDNEVILYCNGTKRGEDLSCTIPTFTTLRVGCSHDGTLQLNSEMGNVKYFKEVLTPAEAIKLTTI